MKLARMTWPEAATAFADPDAVAILPVGAIEAHGPHLSLAADVIIAEAMAEAAAERLESSGCAPVVLPAVWYTAADFAAAFAGTISIQPALVTATITGVAESLARHGVRWLAIANAHLEPDHRRALREATAAVEALTIVFPDVTRREHVARLGEEFRSGACHAGQYETSIVLASAPSGVRDDVRAMLTPNRVSLLDGIQAGKTRFEEMGGPDAYFGDPAAASADEGRETIATLGAILAEAVMAARGDDGA